MLDTPEAVAGYWDLTLPAERRPGFAWPGLLVAPVLVVVLVDPGAYVARYAEPDKAATGLGRGAGEWTVPYWWVDAGAAIQDLLLGVVDAGLGACLFGLFRHEEAVLGAHGVPDGWRAAGTVALGHPPTDADPARPGPSAGRRRPPLSVVDSPRTVGFRVTDVPSQHCDWVTFESPLDQAIPGVRDRSHVAIRLRNGRWGTTLVRRCPL